MHKCLYEQYFRIIHGKLTHCVYANWKGKRLEVYRRDEQSVVTRNLFYNGISGYGVVFPDEKYFCGKEYGLDDWEEPNGKINPYFGSETPNEIDRAAICEVYPNFRYVLQKCDLSYSEVMDILPIWKENPGVEFLLAGGWKRLAFNKTLYRMRPERMKSVLKALRDCAGENVTLSELRKIAAGWTPDQVRLANDSRIRKSKITLEQARYLEANHNIDLSEFADYITMATEAGHDLTDRYWSCPSDFGKRHQKVIREVKRIRKLKDAEALARKQADYEKAVCSMFGKITEAGDIKVYVPETCREIQRHADRLHQCLVTADYIGRVAKRECVLVFLQEKGKPLATAELRRKGRKFTLGQFYGDEHKSDYLAPQRAKEALKNWAEEHKIKIAA